ncbi:MAG: glutamate formimidoyltransferase, partial [Nitrospirota bacterium]|nr:glutamate formimidoyltransferase [Nitrospirota bacterium]
RSRDIIGALAHALRDIQGVSLLDQHMDADHHRSVLTFAGSPEAVEEAAFGVVKVASQLIQLSTHSGVHPRIGATDVLPFVPLRGATMERCVQLAKSVGARIGEELKIPVFLYEEACVHVHRAGLEVIRRGGMEALASRMKNDPGWSPDYGPNSLHPTAGALVVGARHPLIAYNVMLDSNDLSVAQDIAKTVRSSGGGLPFLKALGLNLSSRGHVQVSMNLTNFRETPLHVAFEAVKREAGKRGIVILGSELVGLVPQEAVTQEASHYLQSGSFTSNQVIENQLIAEFGSEN